MANGHRAVVWQSSPRRSKRYADGWPTLLRFTVVCFFLVCDTLKWRPTLPIAVSLELPANWRRKHYISRRGNCATHLFVMTGSALHSRAEAHMVNLCWDYFMALSRSRGR